MHDQTARLATVRLLSPVAGEDVAVDLFFANSGVEAEVVAAAESLEVPPGLMIPVARIGHRSGQVLVGPSAKCDRDLRTLIERADAEDQGHHTLSLRLPSAATIADGISGQARQGGAP